MGFLTLLYVSLVGGKRTCIPYLFKSKLDWLCYVFYKPILHISIKTFCVDLFPQSQTASENVSSLWNPWVQLFVCENATLIVKLNQFFTSPPPDALERMPSELANEWRDFFVDGIYNLLLPLPIKITGVCRRD